MARGEAWRRVAREIKRTLPDARWDLPLPSETDLALLCEVSRNTVRRAYRELIEEGVVIAVPGSGHFKRAPHEHMSCPKCGTVIRATMRE